ncbi:MAG: L,D-transpeptidase family protein [Gammaproteobacteria bacterium]|nr:L,D-transpeptidase family protein [Gammaproteobacteria bacterium]MDP7093960.1 L,D-transpeptidase family protein [Gammaproteobacteria bacterium]MDP7270296.1 L,D-transpeptidase family protein [Gammaproteobacteria bacterium]HJP05266.1 L,D-transpeptidase family protein [Gammaproteobacteria bacterium]
MNARPTPPILFLIFLLTCLCRPLQADEGLANHVVVRKSDRKLYLMRDNEILREFDIALGLMPEGPKVQEGDFRTPEGSYHLTNRRINSDFFMAIQISYPSAEDVEIAKALKVKPGSYIMIHGQPEQPKKPRDYYASYDWTDGCIAVSNAAMVDIWQLTTINTPITITP